MSEMDAKAKNAGSDGYILLVPPADVVRPAFADNNIPVFLGCDDNFFPHAMAVIASLMRRASPANNYDIMIVESGVPPERLRRAAAWMRRYPNASLRFVDVGRMLEASGGRDFPVTSNFSLAMYFRFYAPSIFAGYDKIAYLDSDILLFADVAEFYNVELGGCLLAACHDLVTECRGVSDPEEGRFWREELGKEPGGDYFHSGGVVMDLAGMRRENTESALVAKTLTIRGPRYPDQDVMNAVLRGRVKYLGCEWNYLDWMLNPAEDTRNYWFIGDREKEIIRRARDSYKVLHFSEKKPWGVDYEGASDDLYWDAVAETPFLADALERAGASASRKRYALLTLQELHFKLRQALCGADRKRKYRGRLEVIGLRKRNMRKIWRRIDDFRRGASARASG